MGYPSPSSGAVTSVFGRTGAVTAANGDYAGAVAAALTGATAATRYVGATASGAPAAGTFLLGDFVIDQTGSVWLCTVAGSPGTWTQVVAGGVAAGSITNAMVNAAAAIAYSKLALTGSIVNGDIGAAAAIAYSKLALTGSIVNGDIGAAAAIAYSKLALSNSIVNADIASTAAIAASKLKLSDLASLDSVYPANPTTTSSATEVMMGLGSGCHITPNVTGRIMVNVNGYLINTTSAQVTSVTLRRGTGTAPVNGAAAAGTGGAGLGAYAPAANGRVPFSVTDIISGLTLGTAVWIDLSAGVTGGTGGPASLTVVAKEF